MQGGRGNTGRASVNVRGQMATRLHSASQPQPVVTRPRPATPTPPASTRPVAAVDHQGLIAAGQQTTGGQTVPPPSPVPQPNPNQSVSPNTGQHRPSGPGTAPAVPSPGIKQ